jgi:hypothetical protein
MFLHEKNEQITTRMHLDLQEMESIAIKELGLLTFFHVVKERDGKVHTMEQLAKYVEFSYI